MAEPTAVPAFPPRSSLGDLARGAALPFRAAGWIFRSRKLLALSALSGAITLVGLCALGWLVIVHGHDLFAKLWHEPSGTLAHAAWQVALFLFDVIVVVVGANTVPLALQAPLQDPLSEATEELCGGFQPRPFSVGGLVKGTTVSVTHTFTRILTLLLGQAALLLLNLIPGAGSILWTIASTAWTIVWAGAEYLGAPMARHLYPFKAVREVLRQRRLLTVGFGAAVYVILWVPILNLFFVPLAIVGGTLLYRGLRQIDAIGAPPPR